MNSPKKTLERRILWNFIPNVDEELIEYFFVIINDSREITKLSSRIFEKFSPVQEVRTSDIRGKSKLKARLIYFTSQRFFQNISDVYKGRIKKDSRLYLRHKTGFEGLENYVMSLNF